MISKIRFLLTSKCTASCGYCHNEGQSGQGKSLLAFGQIDRILNRLAQGGRLPDEIILSGGEPTLHKQVTSIAKLCKETGCRLSMDSHGGHPNLLQPVLPYLDELKIHIDSFDAEEQRRSMGLDIRAVETSIRAAQTHPNILLLANHPLAEVGRSLRFVTGARALGIDCKIISLFGSAFAPCVNWQQQGYIRHADNAWLHHNGTHRLFTKSCAPEHNTIDNTLFISSDGVRLALEAPILSSVECFDPLAPGFTGDR